MLSKRQTVSVDGSPIEIRYGKKIDYGKFKKKIISDVQSRIDAIKEEAEQYLTKATREVDCCPLCRSVKIIPFATVHRYPYARCQNCELVFLQRRLSPGGLIEFWKTAVSATTYADPSIYEYRRDNVARPKVDFALGYWQGQPGRWLDIGCGSGDLISVAKQYGWKVLGLELSESCIEVAEEHFNVPVHQMTVQQYHHQPFYQNDWDIISAIGYYDAVDDLREEFKIASSLLKKDGFLFTLSPHHQSISMALALRYPTMPHRFICPPGSTNFFCEQTYNYIAEHFGFKLRAFWYCGMDAYDLNNYLHALQRSLPDSNETDSLQESLFQFQLAVDMMQMSDYVHVLFQKKA